jgi:hypothetical protein
MASAPTTPVRCPRCGGTEVSAPYHSRRTMAWGLLLLGFPFLWAIKHRHCFHVQHGVQALITAPHTSHNTSASSTGRPAAGRSRRLR